MTITTGTKNMLLRGILSLFLLGFAGIGLASIPKQTGPLSDAVRHRILMLPYYDVFDMLGFTIDNSNTVTLNGQVTRPTLKSDAEAVVRSLPGVSRVINNIEVLPLSTFDNSIRVATYRAIYSRPGFERYAIRANAPIRIIVKNSEITLEGVVDNAMDRQMAEMAARRVPYVFRVTDNLTIS
jgi:hyperosmotically inducible periplasmic protein